MAVVYEAEDLLLGRKVAVKVLREQFAADPGFLARFQREARSSAALSHPNIVAVYDVGSEAGTQYIVMELVPGRTLKEILQEEAPLGAARIIELGRQICEGLEYAHQHGIVHRDVKAHNILVTRDGWAKIADFGIAVALGAASLTQSGYVVGSAHYISPEQAKGEQSTASSDLYATGVLLYEMATGRLPFEGETSVAVALKQIQEDPVPPRRLNPRIPESLQTIILRAMAKEPAQRFASAAEMARTLVACARASLEATQPHAVVTPKPGVMMGKAAAAEPVVAPRRGRRGGPGGWVVLLVVFAAFLCTLGSIPLGFLAYSNGTLGRLFPALASPTAGSGGPTAGPAVESTPQPTPMATSIPALRAPKLVGMPFPTAQQQLQRDGLDVVIAGTAYDSEYPANYVVSQKPEAGQPIEKGVRIEVVVSVGRETAQVPRVVEDTLKVAQGKLTAVGFRSSVSEEYSDQTTAGIVMAQSPAPEVSAEKGSLVALRVSKGKEKVAVPNLVGRTEAEAQEMIVKAGLAKDYPNYQDYTFVAPGSVLSQDPKPDTMVEKGTTVHIAVRKLEPSPPAPAPTSTPPTKR